MDSSRCRSVQHAVKKSTIPTHPNRRMWVRLWVCGLSERTEREPLVSVVVLAPNALNDFDRIVEKRIALREIDSECLVLTTPITGRDGQCEPPPREGVQGGGGLGDDEGIAVGEDQDVRNEAQPGDGGANARAANGSRAS